MENEERQELILRLKKLIKTNEDKQKAYREENNSSDDVAYLTRESCVIASLLPKMHQLGVTFDDCK